MSIDVINQRLVAIVVNEDGTISHEVEDRETPLQQNEDHHVYHDPMWVEVRRKRDALLLESDWVTARAYDLGEPVPADWLAYRQALRDITKHLNPFLIEWPTKPGAA